MRFIFSLICLLIAMSVFGQSDVRIHPTQIGLFGAGSGDVLTANPAQGAAQWSTASSVVNGVLSGTANQTLRHNGSIWAPSSLITNNGNFVGIDNTNPAALIHAKRPSNDAFFWIEGYDAEIRIGGGTTYSATMVLESLNSGIKETVTRVVPASRSTELIEYYGARNISRWDGRSGTVSTQDGYPFYQRVWNAGALIEYGYVNKGIEASFTGADLTWLFQVNRDGSFRASNLQGSGTRIAQCAADGKMQASSILISNLLTSSTSFSGDVSGTASNLQINGGAVTGFDIANNTVTSTNLANTGVTSGAYGSSSQTPVITVGTDGRLISASSATTSNLYSTDGTIPASTTRTITLGDGAGLRIDATNWSSSPATPLIVKGNASTASYRFLEAVDSDNTMRFRGLISTSLVSLSSTTRAIEINGATTVGLTCGTGQFIVDAGGYMRLNSLTSNPPSPQNGAFWHNSTEGKLKIRQTTTQTVATVENDVIGNSTATRTGNFTLAEQDFHTILDANTASFTVTLDGTMREGIIYTFECRRNGTNTISFDAASGFVLAFPGLSSFPDDGVVACGGAGTGRQAPHLTYMARRNGANITIF